MGAAHCSGCWEGSPSPRFFASFQVAGRSHQLHVGLGGLCGDPLEADVQERQVLLVITHQKLLFLGPALPPTHYEQGTKSRFQYFRQLRDKALSAQTKGQSFLQLPLEVSSKPGYLTRDSHFLYFKESHCSVRDFTDWFRSSSPHSVTGNQ